MLTRLIGLLHVQQVQHRRRWLRLRRLLRRHHRAVSAGLAALCLFTGLRAVAPPGPVLIAVLVAAHDLTGDHPLADDDLAVARLPPSAVPSGALTAPALAVGRQLAGPMRRGEPITDVRLVGPSLVGALGPGLVATPIRVADPAVAALVRPGDRVDVLAAPADSGNGVAATVQAADVRVIAVPSPATEPAQDSVADGALVVLATTARQALALASASTADRLSLTLRAG